MHLKRLNGKESYDVQLGAKLFCAAPQYMLDTFGRLPSAEDGRRFVTHVPDGCDPQDLLVFAGFEKSTPVGLIQVQRHHMHPHLASIGLLLVDPAHRRRGHGSEMLERLGRQARHWPEVTTFCINVLSTNDSGLAFWRQAGFQTRAEGIVEPGYRAPLTALDRSVKRRPAQHPVAAPMASPAAPARGWLSAHLVGR